MDYANQMNFSIILWRQRIGSAATAHRPPPTANRQLPTANFFNSPSFVLIREIRVYDPLSAFQYFNFQNFSFCLRPYCRPPHAAPLATD